MEPEPCRHCGGPVVEKTVRTPRMLDGSGGTPMVSRKCVNRCWGSQSLASNP